MKLQGRELTILLFGDDVRMLHHELGVLGADIPAAERQQGLFGEGTRAAVADFQTRHGLQATGIVDERTAAAIERETEGSRADAPFAVKGTVRHPDGKPFANGVVRAFDRDLRAEQRLNDVDVAIDRHGRYEIRYSRDRFSRAEKQSADLVVRAYRRGGAAPVAASPILFNAGVEGVVDLVVGGDAYRGPSEYEQLVTQLTPLLGKLSFADLREDPEESGKDKHRDVSFLSGETGLDAQRIAWLVAAHRLLQDTEVPAEVFYGLFRQGLPTDLPSLLAQSPDVHRRALVRSADANIIPPQFGAEADALIDRFKRLIVREAMKQAPDGDGAASVADLLALALDRHELRSEFLSAYLDHRGPAKEFWKRLAATPAFTDRVPDVQLTLQLGALTGNHPPLIRELQRRLRNDDIGAGVAGRLDRVVDVRAARGDRPALAALTSLGERDWMQIIAGRGDGRRIGAPPGVPGKDQGERERNYARAMVHMVEDAFPTAFVTHRLAGDDVPGKDDLLAFFRANPGFNLETTRLDRYVNDHPDAFATVGDVPGTRDRLKAMQRVYKLAPRYEQMTLLLESGLDSAHRITRMGRKAFRRKYAKALGGGEQADSIYANATQATETALGFVVDHAPLVGRIGLNVLPDEPVIEVDGVPEWSSLFGSVELCSCEHCRSVHSPAAYLVDALKFLSERDSKLAGMSAKDILFARRPDLGDIELTCANTNTPLPFVDLVNEALENAVMPSAFAPYNLPAAVEADLNNRQLSQALRNAFNPVLSVDAVITAGAHGKPWMVEPNWWTIDETAFTYTVHRDAQTNQPRVVARSLQTKGTAAERAATPQYINADAYGRLSRAVYPWSLPFSLWWEEARAYLGHLNTPRHIVMERLRPGERPAILNELAVACEYLGVSREIERDVAGNIVAQHGAAPIVIGVTTSDPDAANRGSWNLWGFDTPNLSAAHSIGDPSDRTRRIAAGNWLSVLRDRVDVFLHHSGLSYRELLDLLDTYYVNPVAGNRRAIRIVSTDPRAPETCETRKLRLEGLDLAAAARVVRFVRLWRALGWSMRDLDRAITAFRPAHFDDLNVTPAGAAQNERFIVVLSHLQRLHQSLDVPVVRLVSWWADIDTAFYIDHGAAGQPRAASLYDQLFRNRATVNPPDPAFTEDAAALNGTLSGHAAGIAAALSTSAVDFALMLGDASVLPRDPADPARPDDRLTLDHLSRLHRHASLAKALRLSMRDYLALRRLLGIDPFATTTDTLAFVEAVDSARESGFTVPELDYLLRHTFTPESAVGPTEQTIGTFLTELRAGLQAIAEEHAFRDASYQPASAGSDVDPAEPTIDVTGDLTRQKLALLNWDTDWVNAAVATLAGAVVYQAPLAGLPAGFTLPNATGGYAVNLAALPAGFAVPVELRQVIAYDAAQGRLTATRALGEAERAVLRLAADATGDAPLRNAVSALFQEQDELEGEIAFDASRGILQFTGPMTNARLGRLLGALAANAPYQAAVQELYDEPRRFIGRSMRAFAVHNFAEPLAGLPAVVRIPAALKRKFYFDAPAGRLHAVGVMSGHERATLLNLSADPADANHAAYQAAVNGLYDQAAAYVPDASDAFLTAAGANNDAAALFDASTAPGARFLHVLARLLSYLRRTLSEQFVVEKTADGLQIEARAAGELLRARLVSPVDPLRSCLDELVDPAFARSSLNVAVAAGAFPRQFRTFIRIHKASLVISRFKLSYLQIGWLFAHGPGAGWLALNSLPTDAQDPAAGFEGCRRLSEMVKLREQLLQGERALDEILTRAGAVGAAAPAAARDAAKEAWFGSVARWTRWPHGDLEALLGTANDHTQTGLLDRVFPDDYAGVRLLVRLQAAFDLLKRLAMPASQAADLAADVVTHAAARRVRQAVRARYEDAQWLTLAKPLHDVLREKRRASLVGYLIAHLRQPLMQLETPHPVLSFSAANPVTRPAVRELQQKLNAAGARPALKVDGTFGPETRDAVTFFQQAHGLPPTGTANAATWAAIDVVRTSPRNANDLYAHFLIDVEMSPCMVTSRIKQAIGAVQLFAQRCLMNLEPDVSANAGADEKWREWRWMKQYRVWEANRKIFLYPENWIEPELRDDKSPFFRELESELLQSDLTLQAAEDALLHYLEKLDEVARLDIVGVYHEREERSGQVVVDVLHAFGRTRGVPHVYFYRRRVDAAYWTPWERMDLDIEGDHLIPVVWNRRLLLFWPIFTERARPLSVTFSGGTLSGTNPDKYWEVKLAWSERKRDAWTNRRLTATHIELDQEGLESTDRITFRTLIDDQSNLHVLAYYEEIVPRSVPDWIGERPVDYIPRMAGFRFDGCHSDAARSELTVDDYFNAGFMVDVLRETVLNYMFNRESGDRQLYLPAPGSTPALARTPGTFRVLRYADGSGLAAHPFFFQDDRRAFFVTPYEAEAPPSLRVPPANEADLGLVIDVAEPYWNEVQPLIDGGVPTDPDDPWIDEASFPAMAEGDGEIAGRPGAGGAIASRRARYALYNHRPRRGFQFQTFYHPHVCTFVRELNRNGVDGLLQRPLQLNAHQFSSRPSDPPFDFRLEYEPDMVSRPIVVEPYPIEDVDFDDDGAYALYNWELFFHVPLLIADRLSRNQRYEDAQRWFHYIFDPTDASGIEGPGRYWRTRPFHERTREGYQRERIEYILRLLSGAANPQAGPPLDARERQDLARFQGLVDRWRKNPFKPHLVARLRTTAYQKAVVMKYLDNLIAWADQLFRRDTIESNNEATQLYILAADILGRRPEDVPPRATPRVQTYNSLEPHLDDFSNALVQIEELIPPSAGIGVRPPLLPSPSVSVIPYFCLSRNEKLLGYWDTVADRLFKLRHCLNIEGVARQLPLFEPPIEPGLLVRAAAAGVDLGSVLADLSAAPPHYRFIVLAQKATEVCAELKALGQAMLSALEKRDAEQLSVVRAQQETALLHLVEQVRLLQCDEAEQNKTALSRSRDAAVTRFIHFQKLLGVQSPQVPGIAQPVPESSPSPHIAIQEEGGIKMIPFEQGEMDKLKDSDDSQDKAAWWELAASIGHVVPNFNLEPWGIGATFGGGNVGSALSAVANRFRADATEAGYEAGKAGKLGQYALRAHDWLLQSNSAARDIRQIDQQYLAAEIRRQIADRELASHRRQRDNARETEELLREKYTNRELYGWMTGQLATVYFQTYQLAYDLAKRAERAFRHELGLNESNLIQFGYWDSLKQGLLAGDGLFRDLKRMEIAYLDRYKREYEITKHVSMRQVDPVALLQLRQTGSSLITLPEVLFDLDHPGHYMRRIKSVSVTMPCVSGPYAGIGCTLTLLQSSVRHGNTLLGGRYARQDGDPRFTDSLGAVESMATSSAQNDSGLFETNLRDERYLPFEGAGVAGSTWHIELPAAFRQFDYDTISDVILHVRYTAREGGALLRQQAALELQAALNGLVHAESAQGLAQFFSLRHEFPTEWHRFLHPGNAAAVEHTMTVALAEDRFPFLVQHRPITVGSIEVFVKVKPGFLATHNDATLRLVIAAGDVAPTPANHQPNDLLTLSSWNGMLRAQRPFAHPPGNWTVNAWLDDGGGPSRLDPNALQDFVLLGRYTVA